MPSTIEEIAMTGEIEIGQSYWHKVFNKLVTVKRSAPDIYQGYIPTRTFVIETGDGWRGFAFEYELTDER